MANQPAANPAPVDENFLARIYQQIDKDRSNSINATELQACLSNGTWEPFNAETVRLMITMFDRNHKGQLNFEEFKQLWKYIEDWRHCFQSFDTDKTGNVNKEELKAALTVFGYKLSDAFYDLLMTKFVKGGQGKYKISTTRIMTDLDLLHDPHAYLKLLCYSPSSTLTDF